MKTTLLSPNTSFSVSYDSTGHFLEITNLVRRTSYLWRYTPTPTCLCWSANSEYIALALANAIAPDIYTIATTQSRPAYPTPTSSRSVAHSPIQVMAFSPESTHLAIGRRDGELEIVSLAGQHVIWKHRLSISAITLLSWEPSGKSLVSGRLDGLMLLQDAISAGMLHLWACPVAISELQWTKEYLLVKQQGYLVQTVALPGEMALSECLSR